MTAIIMPLKQPESRLFRPLSLPDSHSRPPKTSHLEPRGEEEWKSSARRPRKTSARILSPPTPPKKKERKDRKKTQRTQCRGGAIEIQAPVGRGRASVGPAAVHVVRERVSRRGRGGGGLGLGVRRGLLLLVLLMLMLGGGGIGPGHRRQRHRGGRRIRCGRIRRRRHRRGPSAPHAAASDAPAGPRAHGGQHAVAPERRHGAVGQGEGRGERGREQRRIAGTAGPRSRAGNSAGPDGGWSRCCPAASEQDRPRRTCFEGRSACKKEKNSNFLSKGF